MIYIALILHHSLNSASTAVTIVRFEALKHGEKYGEGRSVLQIQSGDGVLEFHTDMLETSRREW